MANLLDQIKQLQEQIQSLPPLSAEQQRALDQKFRLEFSYNSNHIEGNTLTYGETELLLLFDKTTGNHDLREYEEMKAHDVAFELIKDWAADKERFITEGDIKNLHQKLLVRPYWKEAITPDGQPTRREIRVGEYKSFPNSVRLQNGEIFHYSSVENTPIEMGELLAWLQEEDAKADLRPVELAALLHYRFVRIHPFDDGNGRLSRLLMNYVLLRHSFPPVVIKTEDKKNYLFALNQADAGNLQAFTEYIFHAIIWSLSVLLKAAKKESIDEDDDWKKKLILLKKKTRTESIVTVKRGKEGYKAVYQNIILPFLENWEDKLKQFEPLFSARLATVAVFKRPNQSSELFVRETSESLISVAAKIFDSNGYPSLNEIEKNLRQLKFSVSLRGLRFTNGASSFNAGEVEFTFEPNIVYIKSVTGDSLSKLYSENIQHTEMEKLTNNICNWLIKNIEVQQKA